MSCRADDSRLSHRAIRTHADARFRCWFTTGPALFDALHGEGVVCDFREPNVIRVAPVPLYNTFHEVWRFAQVLRRHVDAA